MRAKDVNEDVLTCAMDTSGLPDPDLIIRTSGEYRVSNFLPWQSVYSEYLFEERTWPEFTPETFVEILNMYKSRDRRFGAVVGP